MRRSAPNDVIPFNMTMQRGAVAMFAIALLAQAQSIREEYAPTGKLIDVGGYRVHLNCVGSGKPTVMIVGAGYSFDWSLVQPVVSTFAKVCSYDPAGSVWSDPGPAPTCDGRVVEIHKMLANAGIDGPLVLVGNSIGAVFARLYASHYPADVRGMVLIDHAGLYRIMSGEGAQPGQLGQRIAMPSGEESLRKLPSVAQEMHRWASARSAPRAGSSIPFFNSCIAEVAKMPTPAIQPLISEHFNLAVEIAPKDMPLIVIANMALAGSPDYQSAEIGLLALSRNSKAMLARTSGHQVPMDDPAVIIQAIRQVVAAARNQASLK